MVVMHLGWVDSDLGSSPGWWAATAATYRPTGGWNITQIDDINPTITVRVHALSIPSLFQRAASLLFPATVLLSRSKPEDDI